MKILIIFGLLTAGQITKAVEVSTCEPIKSDLCSGKGLYNTTGMPNFAGIFQVGLGWVGLDWVWLSQEGLGWVVLGQV